MASKIVEVLKSCLKHSLLVLAKPEVLLSLLLVSFSDVLQKVLLCKKAFIWILQANEGSKSNVAPRNSCVQGHDVR